MSTGSMLLLSMATRSELSAINDILSPAGIENDVDGYITKEALDREDAQKAQQDEMSSILPSNRIDYIAATARVIHESSRSRRDITIANATHKQLLLGSYKILYQRKLKLERDIERDSYA